MKRRAFTLIELLVVVTIIALLITIALPTLGYARTLARSAKCQGRLHQLAAAFHAVGVVSSDGQAVPVHRPDVWPGVPLNTVRDERIYQCPEEPRTSGNIREYYIHSNFDGQSFNGMGLDIYFDDSEANCKILTDTADYTDYGFDDGRAWDLDTGSIDITIRVTKREPKTGTYMSSSYQGWSGEGGPGILSLRIGGQTVEGWEDFRRVAQGDSFLIGGGVTNYGMNAKVGVHEVAPDTIVLLDYDRTIANDGEDIGTHLAEVTRRHRGKINVLFADESVKSIWSGQLDPSVPEAAEKWDPSSKAPR